MKVDAYSCVPFMNMCMRDACMLISRVYVVVCVCGVVKCHCYDMKNCKYWDQVHYPDQRLAYNI